MTTNSCAFTFLPSACVAEQRLLDAFHDIPTSHISDNLHRLTGITELRRLHKKQKLVGTAVTVKTRPGDNLLIYKALMGMSPGHVLVVDGGGETTNALVGELIMLYAKQRGCVGIVLDGAARDVAAFHEADFPCYARGVSHRGPYKFGPGAVNVPVSICGQVVNPGDIVVGDEDGVVTFPVDDSERLLTAIEITAKFEEAIKAEISTGSIQQTWLKNTLGPHALL